MGEDLDHLVRDAVPGVVAEALDRAREQAVARLADQFTDALVAMALAGTVPGTPPESRPPESRPPESRPPESRPEPRSPQPPDREPPPEALYAYGITPASVRLPADIPPVIGQTGLRLVAVDDLALLVSPVRPDELRVDEEDLSESGRLATLARGHDAVVRAASDAGPVLPLRFGTVVRDDDAARRLLDEHHDRAREQLDRIGSGREWGVKLVRRDPAPSDSPPADSPHSDPSERRGVTGTEYLTRRRQALARAEAAEAGADRAADVLTETLRPHVTDSLRRGGSSGSALLLDLAFLVPLDAEAAFAAAANELGEQLAADGLAVEVSGPWAPYSFASLGAPDA
jgi:hypothetical protein